MQTLCHACGEPIHQVGEMWDHIIGPGQPRPKHPAVPYNEQWEEPDPAFPPGRYRVQGEVVYDETAGTIALSFELPDGKKFNLTLRRFS